MFAVTDFSGLMVVVLGADGCNHQHNVAVADHLVTNPRKQMKVTVNACKVNENVILSSIAMNSTLSELKHTAANNGTEAAGAMPELERHIYILYKCVGSYRSCATNRTLVIKKSSGRSNPVRIRPSGSEAE